MFLLILIKAKKLFNGVLYMFSNKNNRLEKILYYYCSVAEDKEISKYLLEQGLAEDIDFLNYKNCYNYLLCYYARQYSIRLIMI